MSRSLTTAGVEVRSSSRTSTSTRNPRPTPGHPHSTRKSLFNRTADPDHGEMRRLIESTMHVDSKLSANVQFADWVAAAVRRVFEYQLIEDSPFNWVPTAFGDLTRSKLTIESKLYFSHSRGGVRELHNSDIFARERPALAMSISQRLSPEDRIRMEEAKAGILAVARASGMTQ